ncbi:Outer membrane protein A [compost metagenome]
MTVEGHTDRLGSDSYNQKLSEERATAVKNYLVTSGKLDGSKISAVGKGETMPVTKPGDCKGTKRTAALVACLQPDRRVDVEVTGTR